MRVYALSYDAKGEKTMGADSETLPAEEKRERTNEMEAGAEFFTDAVYGDEKSEDCWRRFLHTGRISDYLEYVACHPAEKNG